ncbi:GNAT family N-acetyltransferase [Phaeovulum sp.]|uniref:GNAT family N-acetyltransferase n=1 Tax=Phaeovulum sp. TaxID=2934796 RepID=UPI0035620156
MITLTGAPVLHTARLTLRVPAMRDWEAFAAFLTSDRASYVGGPVTRERAWRAFGHLVGHWVLRGYGMFAVAQKGTDEAFGMAGPWFPENWPEQELAWSIWSPEAEGKGYAFEAAQAARNYAFGVLGWATAVSYIDPENARSIALAKRLDAVIEPGAAHPGDEPTLVFRHSRPETLA